MFPNNTLGPTRQVPFADEISGIKSRCAQAFLDQIPGYVARIYFATQDRDEMKAQVEDILDVFGDAYLNKHVVFSVVELIVVRLFPEIGEKGIEELLGEKIG